MYKISVIIPVYNVKNYIDECINSLRNQTIGFDMLEVIMADDCSTDGSREKIKEYEKIYNNVKCIYLNSNSGGAGKPRNESLREVTADYVMFLDPDDMYYENACEILYNKINKSGVDMVSGNYDQMDEDYKIIQEKCLSGRNIKQTIYHMPNDIDEISKFKYHFSTKLYRTSVIKNNNIFFPEGISADDSYFIWKFIFSMKNAMYIDSTVFKYRVRMKKNRSLSFLPSRKPFDDVEKIMHMISDMFVERGISEKRYLAYEFNREYYICQMIDSELDVKTIREILKKWKWMLDLDYEKFGTSEGFTKVIMGILISGSIETAADSIVNIRDIRRNLLELECGNAELEKGKAWLEEQVGYKNIRIDELEHQGKKQEEAKKWLEEQVRYKNIRIDELEYQGKKQEEAKEWLENQVQCKDIRIKELEDWIKELEKGKKWLEEQLSYKDTRIKELEYLVDQ